MQNRLGKKLRLHSMAAAGILLVAPRVMLLAPVFLLCAILSQGAWAASVGVVGLFKDKAIVSINGSAPKTMAAGQSVQGVKLVSADSAAAVFEVDGKRRTLGMGQSFAATASTSGKPTVLLAADGQGHFITTGAVNGNSVSLLVDTGASSVSLSASEARRMGINYKAAPMSGVRTANGIIPAWNVTLNSVKVGGITLYGVEGLVIETDMPVVLLGMSFLNRTDMKREGQTLLLTQRY